MHVVTTTEPAPDWADELAKQIAFDLRATFHSKLEIGLVASRLRLLKAEGVGEGLKQAAASIEDAFALHKDDNEPRLEVLPLGPGLNA